MVFPVSGTRQYYLGIAGQQSGPFSDAEVLGKIRAGQVPEDALVWYDGLPEWQAIDTVEFFKQGFKSSAEPSKPANDINIQLNYTPAVAPTEKVEVSESQSPRAPQPRRRHNEDRDQGASSTFANSQAVRPVFSGGELQQEGGLGAVVKVLFGAGLLLLAGGTLFYFFSSQFSIKPRHRSLPVVPGLEDNPRELELRQALSEILLNPESSIKTMHQFAVENANEPVGKEALTALLDYYKQSQRPVEAGRLMMELKRPYDAYKYFASDPSSEAQSEAENALFQAFQATSDVKTKQQLLLSDIQLLLGPVNKPNLAMDRINLFVKNFPGIPHPYGFYLKNTEQKIAEVFSKISFYFVQSLLAFSESEFPEIKLGGRPLVEIQRIKNDQFRIVGRYKGQILLNRDRLNNIYFTFWLINAQWYLVQTNLTQERKHWAASNQQRLDGKWLSANEMLNYVEGVFKSQFPDNGFHESVDPNKVHRRHSEE